MLTKRLNYLVDAIVPCNVLADVGCDHGYVGAEALNRGLARQVIFVDISDNCLQKARSNCPAGFKHNASFLCQDGLGSVVCDTAVISGMGGLEILSILNSAKRLPSAIVLQPMRNIVDVRKYLLKHYSLTLDATVYDGKFYSVLVGVRTEGARQILTELETEFGLTNMNNPTEDFVRYLHCEQSKLTAILSQCSSDEVSNRLDKVNRALEQIRRKL